MTENAAPRHDPVMLSGSGAGLMLFLDWSGANGLMAPNTARSYRAAVEAVIRAISDDPVGLGIRGVNLDGIGPLFRERADRQTYSEATINTYIKRFQTAVTEYVRYLDDPDGYRRSGSSGLTRWGKAHGNFGGLLNAAGARVAVLDENGEPQYLDGGGPLGPPPAARSARYPFPLENGGTAFMQVPRDLTHHDVDRLTSFLRGLVVVEPPREKARHVLQFEGADARESLAGEVVDLLTWLQASLAETRASAARHPTSAGSSSGPDEPAGDDDAADAR